MQHTLWYSKRYVCVVAILTLFAFFTPQLLEVAQAGNGGMTTYQYGVGFSCSGGSASGTLYTGAGCSGDPSNGEVFSYFVCKFEEIIVEALSDVYCSIVEESKSGVMAALTLAVLFMGMMFLMGMSPFTAKELMLFAAKFSLVLAFATEAEYMIGIGYALFMNVAKEGIIIVLSYLFEGGYSNSGDVYRMFDDALKEMMSLASQDSRQKGGQCQNALFSMMVLVAAALPPMAMLASYFMVKLVWVMLRAVFGYCQGILGVTFLITLSPIYVSFALFKPTRSLFDKWIQYLISFSFQMVVVFAFLGMAFNIIKKMADDVADYTQLVKPYNREIESGAGARALFDMCGICEMDKVGPKEKPRCKSDKVMEIGQLSQDENFMHFASVKIIAMVIMFYILDIMMDFVPQMARHLAGQKYAGQIGGGDYGGSQEVDMSLPGEKNIRNALHSGAQAFMGSGNSATGFARGVGAALNTGMRGFATDAGNMIGGAAATAGAYSLLRGNGATSGAGFAPKGAGGGDDSPAPGRRSDAGDDREGKTTVARADTVGNAARNERSGAGDNRDTDGVAVAKTTAAAQTGRTGAVNASGADARVSQYAQQIKQTLGTMRIKPDVKPSADGMPVIGANVDGGLAAESVAVALSQSLGGNIRLTAAMKQDLISQLAVEDLDGETMASVAFWINSIAEVSEGGDEPPSSYA